MYLIKILMGLLVIASILSSLIIIIIIIIIIIFSQSASSPLNLRLVGSMQLAHLSANCRY